MTYQEPGFIARMQPALYQTYQKIGVNPEKDYLEVAPTCHFFMGGIRVDQDWQSTVPGLFAAGENVAGIHGANRLSQNALAEVLVSGTRAGKSAARFAAEVALPPVDPKEALAVVEPAFRMLKRDKGLRPIALRNRLRRLMWEKVAVFRTRTRTEERPSGSGGNRKRSGASVSASEIESLQPGTAGGPGESFPRAGGPVRDRGGPAPHGKPRGPLPP